MKLVRPAYFRVTAPQGHNTGNPVLKAHRFNFVKYNVNDDWLIEPENAEGFMDPDLGYTTAQSGNEEVYYDGIEIVPRLGETGFDDARDFA